MLQIRACKHIIFSLFLLFAFSQSAKGQVGLPFSVGLVGVGLPGIPNVLANYPTPYANKAPDYRARYLIDKNEFTNPGEALAIRSIGFNVVTANGQPLMDFTIRMKTTTDSALSKVPNDAGLMTVYGPTMYIEQSGMNVHQFPIPFCWDGTDNLIIDICVRNDANDFSYNASVLGRPHLNAMSYHDWAFDGKSKCQVADTTQPQIFNDRPDITVTAIHRDSLDLIARSSTFPPALVEYNTTHPVDFSFQNYSCKATPANTTKVAYQLNNDPVVRVNFPGALAVGAYGYHLFTQQITYTNLGFNDLKIWVENPDEDYHFNDTLFKLVWVKDTIFDPIDYSGEEFWLAFMKNYDNNSALEQRIYVTSPNGANVKITAPRVGWSTTLFVPKNQVKYVTVPLVYNTTMMATDQSEQVSITGIFVESDEVISVYGYSGMKYSTDGFLAIPTKTLSQEYTVIAPKGIYNATGSVGALPLRNAPAEFIVVGTEDSTDVEIILTEDTEKNNKGDTIHVRLDKAETYLVVARVVTDSITGVSSSTVDLTGCQVNSNRKVVVISGAQCAMIPGMGEPGACDACDHVIEEMTPQITWGKSFYSLDFQFKQGDDIMRIVAEDAGNTTVTINGLLPFTLTGKGSYMDYRFQGNIQIDSDKPVQVVQMCTGGQCAPKSTTDPFMTNLIPAEQWSNYYSFTTPTSANFRQHYCNVVKKGQYSRLALNGTVLQNNTFSRIGLTDYYARKVNLKVGSHIMTGDSNFIVYTYGFGLDDSYGYPASGAKLLAINVDPIDAIGLVYDNKCFDGDSGIIDVTVQGGARPFTYKWSTGDTVSSIRNLKRGTYYITVTDYSGNFDIDTFIVGSPDSLEISFAKQDISCFGLVDGSIQATGIGGVSPYQFSWDGGAFSSKDTLQNLAKGTYHLTIRDTNNCLRSDSTVIIEPQEIQVQLSLVEPLCFGDANGSVEALVIGGTQPYIYQWDNNSSEDSSRYVNRGAGPFRFDVWDLSGCTVSVDSVLSEPSELKIQLSKADISCYGLTDGQLFANNSGGTSPYRYTWSMAVVDSFNPKGLVAGNYSLTVEDKNACLVSESMLIIEPDSLSMSLFADSALCFAGNEGKISSFVSGGSFPYSYNWSSGDSTNQATNLVAGWHTLTLVDYRGCSKKDSAFVEQPGIINSFYQSQDASCFGESDGWAVISSSGGTGKHVYQWNTSPITYGDSLTKVKAGNYLVSIEDANKCLSTVNVTIGEPVEMSYTIKTYDANCNQADGAAKVTSSQSLFYSWQDAQFQTFSTLDTVSQLLSGKYTLYVSDLNGCAVSEEVTIDNLGSGTTFILDTTDVKCYGGKDGYARAGIAGGTAPFTYVWSHGDNDSIAENLFAGSYVVEVIDALGCKSSAKVDILQPDEIKASFQTQDANCNLSDGIINMNVAGGVGAYTYLWSTGATSKDLNNVPAGGYSVFVEDSSACQNSFSVALSDISGGIASISILKQVTCHSYSDGELQAIMTGGNGPFLYNWSNGNSGAMVNNLSRGSYFVTITDSNACKSVAQADIIEPDTLTMTFKSYDPKCNGESNGVVSSKASGGIGSYSYRWNTNPVSTTQAVFNLPAGQYIVSVSDANNCAIADTVNLIDPLKLGMTLNPSNIDCFGASTGEIEATPVNGLAPYSYSWNDPSSQTGFKAIGLQVGTYALSLTDRNNCLAIDSMTLQENSELKTTLSISKIISCNGDSDGELTSTSVGGQAPYSYSWSNGVNTALNANLAQGTYTITVTDDLGCQDVESMLLTEPAALTMSFLVEDITCFGSNDGRLRATPLGGRGQFSYLWSNSQTSQQIQGLGSGYYSVEVEDSMQCKLIDSAMIVEPLLLTSQEVISHLICFEDSSGLASITGLGGRVPYNYSWSTGSTGSQMQKLMSGRYDYTISDSSGCTFVDSVFIHQPDPISIDFQVEDVKCFGDYTGGIVSAISGGTGAYQYNWIKHPLQVGDKIENLAAGVEILAIIDANGCVKIDSVEIQEPDKIDATIIAELSCRNAQTGKLIAQGEGGLGILSYHWSQGSQGKEITNIAPGKYNLSIIDENNCLVYYPGILVGTHDVWVDAGSNQTVIHPNNVELSANSNLLDSGQYTWSPYRWIEGEWNQKDILAQLDTSGYVMVSVIDPKTGCREIDSVFIRVIRDEHLGLPNVFTPNGDGTNDYFFPMNGQPYELIALYVYNRWGELIYAGHESWDGTYQDKVQPIDTYMFRATIRSKETGKIYQRKGNVTLLK